MKDISYLYIEKLIDEGRAKEALPKLELEIASNPKDFSLLMLRAKALASDRSTYKEAEELLYSLYINNDSYKALYELGNFYYKKKELLKAEACYDKVTKMNSGKYRNQAFEQLGRIYRILGDYDKARYCFKKNNNQFTRQLEIAKTDIAEGKKDEGKAKLKGLLKTEAGPYANIELGKLEADNSYLLSLSYLTDALDSGITGIAFYEMGALEFKYDNLAKAAMYVNKALENGYPNKEEAEILLERIYAKLLETYSDNKKEELTKEEQKELKIYAKFLETFHNEEEVEHKLI